MPPSPSRTDRPFLEAVRTGVLVVDGAMGSQLYERGVLYGTNCFEQLNVSHTNCTTGVNVISRAPLRAAAIGSFDISAIVPRQN